MSDQLPTVPNPHAHLPLELEVLNDVVRCLEGLEPELFTQAELAEVIKGALRVHTAQHREAGT